VHVPSRRSLREDTNFDNLISALVQDIDKYEEQVRWRCFIFWIDKPIFVYEKLHQHGFLSQEEMAFLEEGSGLNKEV